MTKSALFIEMIDLLRRRPGVSVGELAGALSRSERTVYRWLSELSSDVHVPIYCSSGGYYLAGNSVAANIDLTCEELLALRLSLNSAPFSDGSPVEKHARSAWQKIRDATSCDRLAAARDLAGSHAVDVTTYDGETQGTVVNVIESAINDRRRLRVRYRSQKSSRVKEYTIDPYAVVFRRHSWYVLAFCVEHDKVIQLKLVRFKRVEDTGARFASPPQFSLEEYFQSSWEAWAGGEATTVRIRFSPKVAEMVAEAKRHPTQTVYRQSDGSIIFEATVSGIEEIATWVMGYGKEAQVLEPKRLKHHVRDHAKAVLSQSSEVLDEEAEELVGGLT